MGRGLVWHRLGRNKVAPAEFDTVQPGLPRGNVDQPFHRIDRFGPAGAAIGRQRRGIGEHQAAHDVEGGKRVDRWREAQREHQRHAGRARDIGTDRMGGTPAQSQEIPLFIQRKFTFQGLVASLVVADKRFRAFGDPFHRTAHPARCPENQRLLRVDAAFHAEATADIARDDAEF